jgi:hypothetical protein
MKIANAAFAFVLLSSGAAMADTKVLEHHVAQMKTGNLEAVLSDYAPNAVIVTPPGAILTNKENLPGNKTMQVSYENLGPDTTLMRWVQYKGTPKQLSGHDVFVVRGGKIVFQTVSIDPPKK